ncbi:hypothetical protein Ahy_B05g077845 isoform F [Arachis hypogaea]|uniref:Uncharacterized protein n=1 Tax=Arachis hypogaea TaxID=3818 RepID=A0A444Y4I2_ARAHY|nr:hypothetical protein Ahy_B08g092712 isoform E [Arachis hypogaea]RYR09496.1 hypothetical protein Ahy_B05g077845 isoform F [Arachis hypogaea]
MRYAISSTRLSSGGKSSINAFLPAGSPPSTFLQLMDLLCDFSCSTWPKQLNASLEEVDPEIADIIELEKARQWKVY